jgi:hypothetical protein
MNMWVTLYKHSYKNHMWNTTLHVKFQGDVVHKQGSKCRALHEMCPTFLLQASKGSINPPNPRDPLGPLPLHEHLLTLESVRTKTKTSRGYKSPYIFIEVVLLCYDFCGTLGIQNVGLLQKFVVVIKEKVKMQKWKMFLFCLKKVPENGPGTTHIHTFKVNKKNFLTSIIVGLKISDHIKNKRK